MSDAKPYTLPDLDSLEELGAALETVLGQQALVLAEQRGEFLAGQQRRRIDHGVRLRRPVIDRVGQQQRHADA